MDAKTLWACPATGCNLNCVYCYQDTTRDGIFLDYDKFTRFTDFFFDRGEPEFFGFIGGEPTIHPRIVDMVSYVREKDHGMRIQISTNGVIPQNKLERLIDYGTKFVVSFEGLPRFQDSERPFHDSRGSSGPVLHTLERLADECPDDLWIQMSHSLDKLGHEEEMVEFLASRGIKGVALGATLPEGRGEAWPETDVERCYKELPGMVKMFKRKGVEVCLAGIHPYRESNWISSGLPCGAGESLFSLTADGKIATCLDVLTASGATRDFKRFIVGDVGETVEIDRDRLREFMEFVRDIPEECHNCPVRDNCTGCPFMKVTGPGGTHFKKSFCDKQKVGLGLFLGTEE